MMESYSGMDFLARMFTATSMDDIHEKGIDTKKVSIPTCSVMRRLGDLLATCTSSFDTGKYYKSNYL